MKILVITQARIASTRLPRKVLLPLGASTVLQVHLDRLKRSKRANLFLVATTHEPESEKIQKIAEVCGWQSYQGSVDDVLDRFYQAAKPLRPDHVVRVTSDCPLIDPSLVDDLIAKYLDADVDYASNILRPTLPNGMDCEVFRFQALEKAWHEAKLLSEREHVTPYIWKNTDLKGGKLFSAFSVEYSTNRSNLRLTIDHSEDYALIAKMVKDCGVHASLDEYLRLLVKNPDYLKLNSQFKRGEGYEISLKKDGLK